MSATLLVTTYIYNNHSVYSHSIAIPYAYEFDCEQDAKKINNAEHVDSFNGTHSKMVATVLRTG